MTSPAESAIQEKVLAGDLLTAGAAASSKVIDGFVSWLVTGAGAALTLLISNASSLSAFLAVENLACSVRFYLLGAALTILEKYWASIIAGSAASLEFASEKGRRLAEEDVPINFSIVFDELSKATVWPGGRQARARLDEARRGDFAANGRRLARLAQFQGWIAIVISALVVVALGIVACSLKA